MPKLDGILETAIHTEDMARSRAFYEGVFGLEPIYSDDRLSAYAVAGRDVLLVFRKGKTGQTVTLPSGTRLPTRHRTHLHVQWLRPCLLTRDALPNARSGLVPTSGVVHDLDHRKHDRNLDQDPHNRRQRSARVKAEEADRSGNGQLEEVASANKR